MNEQIVAAIKAGDGGSVGALLQEDPNLAGGCDEHGVSLIFIALYHHQEAIAKMLADKVVGMSIHEVAGLGLWRKLENQLAAETDLTNTFSGDGFTPLHLAAYFGREQSVDVLLRLGAEVNRVTNNPMALQPLHSAVAGGNSTCVRHLLEAGAPVNQTQAGKITPLMGAAAGGHCMLVDLLLSFGADPHAHCAKGLTALDYARRRNHQDVVLMLEQL